VAIISHPFTGSSVIVAARVKVEPRKSLAALLFFAFPANHIAGFSNIHSLPHWLEVDGTIGEPHPSPFQPHARPCLKGELYFAIARQTFPHTAS
jgi:hypothetical protein